MVPANVEYTGEHGEAIAGIEKTRPPPRVGRIRENPQGDTAGLGGNGSRGNKGLGEVPDDALPQFVAKIPFLL